jgi:glutathione S-transferase
MIVDTKLRLVGDIMSTGKLFGDTRSRAFRCVWTLSELGLEYEQNELNLKKGEALTPDFLKINPIGRIPVWKDDSGVLSESMAICLWIAGKDKTNSLSFKEGSFFRAKLYQWLSFTISELEQPLWNIRRHHGIYPEKYTAKNILPSCQHEFKRAYKALLSSIKGDEYLINNTFSLADIFVGQTLFWARQTTELEIDLSEVKEYMKRLKSRERFPKL